MPKRKKQQPAEGEVYRFATLEPGDDICTDLSTDARLACLAVCIADQQRAGFGSYIDLREAKCPDCGGSGFNTGWGDWRFACGNEILTDGTPGEGECRGEKPPTAAEIAEAESCAAGQRLTSGPCPKCGATMDDACRGKPIASSMGVLRPQAE